MTVCARAAQAGGLRPQRPQSAYGIEPVRPPVSRAALFAARPRTASELRAPRERGELR